MKFNFAYFDFQGRETAVFEAGEGLKTDAERLRLGINLLTAVWSNGLRVKSVALVWRNKNHYCYYGLPEINRHLQKHGPPAWTHRIDVCPTWETSIIEQIEEREDSRQDWLMAMRAVPCVN